MSRDAPHPPARPPVSDEVLRRFVGYHLKLAFNAIRSDLSEILEPLGLRMITYSALALIVNNPGLRPSQLAQALSIERPNLVVIMDELESRKLILRQRDSTDRRAYALTPTDDGRVLCEKALSANMAREEAMLAGISANDMAALFHVLDQIKTTGKREAA